MLFASSMSRSSLRHTSLFTSLSSSSLPHFTVTPIHESFQILTLSHFTVTPLHQSPFQLPNVTIQRHTPSPVSLPAPHTVTLHTYPPSLVIQLLTLSHFTLYESFQRLPSHFTLHQSSIHLLSATLHPHGNSLISPYLNRMHAGPSFATP